MLYFLKNVLQKTVNIMGYRIVRIQDDVSISSRFPDIIEQEFIELYEKCRPYTITSPETMHSLYKAVEYIVKHNVPGDMVECGIYKGGSSMLMAHALVKMGECKRSIYLYDTYAGMSRPTDKDIDFAGRQAIKDWVKHQQNKDSSGWIYCSLEEARHNMFSTGYPKEKLIFVKGKVEDTIPSIIPEKICLLRLDTDWYASTYHELDYLFPRLSTNGVIIIDDYGYYRGAREAVDKYFQEKNVKILLNRINLGVRVGIKVDT